jgi:N-acetylmuramoyl-L-alanine amidase
MNEHLLATYVCETKVDPVSNNSLQTVADAANAWGADLLVSNHFNAGGGNGFEALVYSEKRKDLGLIFERHVKSAGQNSRGVKYRPGLAVLRLSNMPAVLNEGAFVDNLEDIQDWNDDAELKKLGIAYAEAAAEYLKLEKKVSKPKVKTFSVSLSELSYGAKGNDSVKALQILLNGFGYNVSPTGNFGDGTRTVVKNYQKAKKIPVTGVADAATWKALLGIK